MARMTIQDRIVRYFVEAEGAKVVKAGQRTELRIGPKRIWVGSHGSVRTGDVISRSVNIAPATTMKMLAWELKEMERYGG